MQHLVSDIVPVYNGELYLEAALQSILSQDYQSIEIIVVDDGSSDRTAQIARAFKNVRYLYQDNQGQAGAMNAGLLFSSGLFITFLDADDLWVPHNLSTQVSYLLEHSEVDMVLAGRKNFVDPDTKTPLLKTKDLAEEETVNLTLGSMVARRSVFDKIGHFDTMYKNAKDVDWFIRAREGGIKMKTMSEIVLFRRLHDSNRSYETKNRTSEFLRAVKSSIDRKRSHADKK